MNKTAKRFLIVGIILIIIALLLGVYFEWEEIYSKRKSNEAMKIILEETKENKTNDTIDIDGTQYIGYLSIPGLELNLPVTKEYSYASLNKAPSVYYGSILNNNLVICGHSYKSHFGNLYKLKKGDTITITDVNNNKYTYQVELIETLSSTDVKEMIESDFDLTIYTCTKDGLKRVTVRCNKI